MPNELEALAMLLAEAVDAAISAEQCEVPAWPSLKPNQRLEAAVVMATALGAVLKPTTLAALPGLEAGTMVPAPVDPTEAMISAGWEGRWRYCPEEMPRDVWKAMLAASKEQPR